MFCNTSLGAFGRLTLVSLTGERTRNRKYFIIPVKVDSSFGCFIFLQHGDSCCHYEPDNRGELGICCHGKKGLNPTALKHNNKMKNQPNCSLEVPLKCLPASCVPFQMVKQLPVSQCKHVWRRGLPDDASSSVRHDGRGLMSSWPEPGLKLAHSSLQMQGRFSQLAGNLDAIM